MLDTPPPVGQPPEMTSTPGPGATVVTGPSLVISGSIATMLVGVVMLVVGLAAGFLLRPLVGGFGSAVATTAPEQASSGAVSPAEETQVAADGAALMAALVQQTRHFIGDVNAPVTIIEFADFQCPYCGRFHSETYGQLTEDYIASGQVRLGYLHFAFLGQESLWAAEASECADDQGQFWAYHDYLFTHQNGENQGAFVKENLKDFAAALGLDTAAFNQCLDNGDHAAQVAGETQAAQQLGVRSTPTFVLNGRPILGAQPFSVFQQYIEQALGGN